MPYVVLKVNGKKFGFPNALFYEADVDRWQGEPDRYEIINVVTRRRSVVGGGVAKTLRRHAQRAAGRQGSTQDVAAQQELELFAENDGDLYRQMVVPIRKNLVNKMANGTYVHARGVDGFMHFIDEAARRYTKQFGTSGDTMSTSFKKLDRRVVAERFADELETEYKLGNYNYLLTAAATRRATAAGRLPRSKGRTPGGSSR